MTYYTAMTVRGHAREVPFAERFGLHLSNAQNGGVDAWMIGRTRVPAPFELKTSGAHKTSICIGSEVGLHKTAGYGNRYWLFNKVHGIGSGYVLDPESYFLAPLHMAEFIARTEERILRLMRIADYAEAGVAEAVLSPAEQRCLPGIGRRMRRLPSVSLSWSYVRRNGILMTENYPAALRRLVLQFPLDTACPARQINPSLHVPRTPASIVPFSANYLKRAI